MGTFEAECVRVCLFVCIQQTALHWSAFYNHPEHVKLLIKHDSNIGIPDSEGKIPLHWAAHNKHPNATHTVRCILVRAHTHTRTYRHTESLNACFIEFIQHPDSPN